MTTHSEDAPRPLPERPNLRHLKNQAKDLLKDGAADSLSDAQFKIARLQNPTITPLLLPMIRGMRRGLYFRPHGYCRQDIVALSSR